MSEVHIERCQRDGHDDHAVLFVCLSHKTMLIIRGSVNRKIVPNSAHKQARFALINDLSGVDVTFMNREMPKKRISAH
jgi:hypothetical protein